MTDMRFMDRLYTVPHSSSRHLRRSEALVNEGRVEGDEQHQHDDQQRQRRCDQQIAEPAFHRPAPNIQPSSVDASLHVVMNGTQPTATSTNVTATPAAVATGERYSGWAVIHAGVLTRMT